jgi:hypothetical protein
MSTPEDDPLAMAIRGVFGRFTATMGRRERANEPQEATRRLKRQQEELECRLSRLLPAPCLSQAWLAPVFLPTKGRRAGDGFRAPP